MTNRFQKLIYTIAAFSPVIIIFVFCWWWQTGRNLHSIALGQILAIAISTISILAFFISFKYARRTLHIVTVRIVSLEDFDRSVFSYVFTYIAPFATFAIPSYHLKFILGLVAIVLCLVFLLKINFPNPLLIFFGYHFWNVGVNDAASGYILISKRKLQGPKNVHLVKQYFNSILIDAER